MTAAAELSADELRAKYSRPRDVLRAEAAGGAAAPSSGSSDTLSRVQICSACQAQGIIKKQRGAEVECRRTSVTPAPATISAWPLGRRRRWRH